MNKAVYDELAQKLLDHLKRHKDEFIDLSMQATGNNRQDTSIDLNRSLDFLTRFQESNLPRMRKPKGKILIMLSRNEPLLISIIPIFSALAMGNQVTVRPSSTASVLVRKIWQIDAKAVHSLVIDDFPVDKLDDAIQSFRTVYFFGSHHNARQVYASCAKHFVEFVPEIEAADTKVYYAGATVTNDELEQDVRITIDNAFSHDGKICQRLTGVYVNDAVYLRYLDCLGRLLEETGFEEYQYKLVEQGVLGDIQLSHPEKVYRSTDSYVVINPASDSLYATGAYFDKSLWIQPYSSIKSLLDDLDMRPYRLGLNIVSDDTIVTQQLIQQTNFSRYTLRPNHCDISHDSGWGGHWPTGSGGYKDWYSTFSNSYAIIAQ